MTVEEADVLAAYRLLLGRAPDPDGWHNYGAMVGKAKVGELVGSIMSSEEFRHTPMHSAVQRDERKELEAVKIGNGLRLFVSPHDLLNEELLRSGTYEDHLARALGQYLKPGMTFCAIGANIGYHAIRAASIVGESGRVFAFEAHPENAELVTRSVALNRLGNALVLPLAISDRRASHRYVAAQGTNGYIEQIDGTEDLQKLHSMLIVQSVRLDDLFGLLAPVDVLQMDIEGSEGRALRGASRLLERCKPLIFSELCIGQLSRTSDMSGEEYLAILRDLGYEFSVLGFDGKVIQFGESPAALCEYARVQPTSHIDIMCRFGST